MCTSRCERETVPRETRKYLSYGLSRVTLLLFWVTVFLFNFHIPLIPNKQNYFSTYFRRASERAHGTSTDLHFYRVNSTTERLINPNRAIFFLFNSVLLLFFFSIFPFDSSSFFPNFSKQFSNTCVI